MRVLFQIWLRKFFSSLCPLSISNWGGNVYCEPCALDAAFCLFVGIFSSSSFGYYFSLSRLSDQTLCTWEKVGFCLFLFVCWDFFLFLWILLFFVRARRSNLVHLREGRLKMKREGRRVAREMLRPATDTYH